MHWPPHYIWNTVEKNVKHHTINRSEFKAQLILERYTLHFCLHDHQQELRHFVMFVITEDNLYTTRAGNCLFIFVEPAWDEQDIVTKTCIMYMHQYVRPNLSGPLCTSILDGFQYKLAQLFPIMSRCAIWRFYLGRSKSMTHVGSTSWTSWTTF